MAANSITGLNQVFPIYNQDGTPFNNMVLHKASVNSVVMSLGDKITGEAYYRDNALNVTMQEYIVYNGVKYTLVNPPTIVREGLVQNNSELKGMTKYSFEFYHPMCQLSNLPFSDVAISSSEERYLSENKTFSWIGKPQDLIDKLNKNLEGTQWIVVKSSVFPQDKENELSDVIPFDNNMVSDALKVFYDTWGIPYIIDVVSSSEASYAQGKRFKVICGYPSNEIYANETDRQSSIPYVFRMGQGVGLKNNSRTPRNNKIITRISGYGSEDNIPYGYPQIVWNGSEDDPRLQYPLYDGIVGGRNVKLIQHPFTRKHLMPSVYTDAVNKKVNPDATGYNPNIELKDYYDAIGSEYTNQINPLAPSYEIHEFDDIKPEMNDGSSNVEILGAVPLNDDLTPASEWIDDIDGEGNFVQSYFRITLPQLAFDLYACAAITQDMQINMRSGDCIGCTFPVQVDWDDYKLNFYDENGDFAPDGAQRDLTKYPKSNLGSISVVVQKENSTFGTIMPSRYQQPQSGDEFVILGISLPAEYITNAEQRLDDAMRAFMLENNIYYYDYPLKFDEHFLATHTYILSQLRPNSIVRFDFAGSELQLYVKQITIKYGNSILPEYDITLTDNIEVVLNQIGQAVEEINKLGTLLSVLRQSYSSNMWIELAKKLSKVSDDTAQGFIRFIKGLQVGNQFVTGLLGEGGVFRKEADGTTYLEADKMYIRIKAYFDNVEIRDYKHSAGNRIASPAGAKCCRVEYIDANGSITTNVANAVKFRCYFRGSDGEDEVRNNFVVGDQAYCHITSVDTKDDDPNSKSLNMKHYWRLVVGRNATNVLTENGEHWIDLSNRASETLTIDGTAYTHAGYQNSSDVPAAQDDIIQLGNINDTDRMGAIIEFVTGADAPSYQIFQGINDFNLNGKNYIGLGYSTQTGRAYMNVYGDAYIGDKPDQQGNARSFLKYNAATRQLSIKARIDATSTIDGATIEEYIEQHSSDWSEEEINSLIHDVTDDIQAQIDGAIDTWFYNGTPSDSVLPESEWKAIDIAAGNNNERLKHLGDIYYDNETGYAYRYSNSGTEQAPVFVWNPITDSAVVEALQRAAHAQDTADGKRTIYSVWDAWMKGSPSANTLEIGDLFIPQSDTTQGGVTYKANKVYKCTTKGSATFQEVAYTDDSAFNGYISAILNGSGSSGDAATVAAAQKAIKDALGGGTTVDGGLLLTSLIAMRKYKGSGSTTDIANYDTWAGISGLRKDTEEGTGWKGYGIAAWYGGAMVDHEVSTTATDYAKSLFRFDGSGYLASGNISWDKDGIVTIANVYSDVNGQAVEWSGTTLQYMNNLSNSLPLTYQSSVAYFDPQLSFTNLSIMGKAVATQEWIGQNYISIAFFSRLFRAYNGTTLINANDTTSTIDNIKAMFGFWTEQYVSSLGRGTDGGGGGVGDVTWTLLADNTDTRQIALSHLTTALTNYATQSWVQLQGYLTDADLTGYATEQWVGEQGYVTSSGVTSVAAGTGLAGGTITSTGTISISSTYRTYISNGRTAYGWGNHAAAGYAYATDLANYLSLSGGEMANTGLVTNLNADLLDGQHGSYYAAAADVTTLQGYFTNGVADKAEQLNTSRNIWGQSFNGTADVSGNMAGVGNISFSATGKNIGGIAYFDTTNSRLGVGTSSPSYKLHVSGTFYASGNSSVEGTFGVTGATTLTGLLTANSGIVVPSTKTVKIGNAYISYDSTNNAIRVSANADGTGVANFYAMGAVSALGAGTDQGGGVGDVTWTLLADNTDTRQIAHSHLTSALATYATRSWVEQQLTGGTVTAVKVGSTTYNPDEGIVSLPAYPTTLPASDVSAWAKADTKPSYAWSEIGSKPTTISGYGITDAKIKSGVITLGGSTITPVTSVAMTVPTGFSVSGSPISKTGTLALSYASGYEGFTTTLKNKIDLLYSLFTREGAGTTENPYVIKANYGLYTDSFLSALGQGSDGSSGTGDVTWALLADTTDTRQIALSHLTTALSSYNPTNNFKTINGYSIIGTGDIDVSSGGTDMSTVWTNLASATNEQINVSHLTTALSSYNPTNNFKTINNQSIIGTGDIQVGGGSSGNYLPLTGGTIRTDNNLGAAVLINNGSQYKASVLLSYGEGYGMYVASNYTASDKYLLRCSNQTDFGGIGETQRFSVFCDGRTEIGTVHNAGSLAVYGIESCDFSCFWNISHTGYAGYVGRGSNSTNTIYLCAYSGNRLLLGANNHDGYLTIGTNGFVGLNFSNTDPSYRFDLFHEDNTWASHIIAVASERSACYLCHGEGYGAWIGVSSTDSSHYILSLNNNMTGDGNGSNILQVTANGQMNLTGNFTASGGVTSLSDIRHKTIINPTDLKVEQIAKMPAVVYRWNDGREDNGLHVGSIAQDWQRILPEVVMRANNKEGTLSMQYGVAALVSSIIIARKVVDYERRIAKLERENIELKNYINDLKTA